MAASCGKADLGKPKIIRTDGVDVTKYRVHNYAFFVVVIQHKIPNKTQSSLWLYDETSKSTSNIHVLQGHF